MGNCQDCDYFFTNGTGNNYCSFYPPIHTGYNMNNECCQNCATDPAKDASIYVCQQFLNIYNGQNNSSCDSCLKLPYCDKANISCQGVHSIKCNTCDRKGANSVCDQCKSDSIESGLDPNCSICLQNLIFDYCQVCVEVASFICKEYNESCENCQREIKCRNCELTRYRSPINELCDDGSSSIILMGSFKPNDVSTIDIVSKTNSNQSIDDQFDIGSTNYTCDNFCSKRMSDE